MELSFQFLMSVLMAMPHLFYGSVIRRSADDACNQLRVAITVYAKPRYMELSWDNANPLPGDLVALFNKDPLTTPLPSPVASVTPNESSGFFNTSVLEPSINSSTLSFQKECLGYWVAYVRDDAVISSNCLSTQPTWMKDMKDKLTPLKLRDIFLPGTHDSGAYKKYDGEASETLITKYSITQEEDILSQLVHGIRYLDIRVGYYAATSELWWVNHGIVRLHPLQNVVDAVRKFITSTEEIVIVDIQEFPSGFGTGDSVHYELVKYLNEQFGSLLASPTLKWDVTVGDIWSSGNRLILSYDKKEIVAGSSILWPAVIQKWGNVQTLEDLHEYLASIANEIKKNTPTAAMAELTPTTWDVITDQLGGLRRMADSVNRNVTAWYWGEWGRTVNVVAADFFKGTGLVEAAIEWNTHRAQNITCAP